MPNASTTPIIDSSTTTGSPLPLPYGFYWGTGKRLQYYQLQNTGNSYVDFTRVGMWSLGEGEQDGCQELWINDQIVWTSEWDDPTQFHYHRGTDATVGAGLYAYSSGPDQGVDSFFSSFPSAIQPLAYTQQAYYAIKRKQPIPHQENDHQKDPTQWGDINPIGLWRGLRVRLFDDEGNMTAYAFSTNPAWQIVDAILRRKVAPEYNIDLNKGIDDLAAAARNRFDWGSIYQAAQYFDQRLANGRRRFSGNYAFVSQATLAAILEQMLKCCRSFIQEYGGKISLKCDMPRPSVFTISREHVMAGSLAPSDEVVAKAGNAFVGKFRDLLVPAAAEIASIACADHQNPVITTVRAHPFNQADRISIGGTDTIFDGEWYVASVPDGDSIYTLSLMSKGSNYPSSVGAGGYVGLLYSRFKERAPLFNHKQNQLARGMVGLGLPRQLNAIPTEIDYAVTTFDQASRLTRYERDRALGLDQSPYVTPRALSLVIPLFAADASGSGAAAIQIQDGDRITINDKASYAYAGDYEVLDHKIRPVNPTISSSGSTLEVGAEPTGGEIELSLGPYDETVMYDSTDPDSAPYENVPDSDPGNEGSYTLIALAGAGKLAFFTGSVPSGGTFNLPSSGFNADNLVAWVSPQGFVEGNSPMQVIALCSVDQNRLAELDYTDGGSNWHGDLNFAAGTWIGGGASVTTATVVVGGKSLRFTIFTLAGGEQICFGQGMVPHGAAIDVPPGFTTDQMFAMAFPFTGVPVDGHDAHWVGCYVDDSHIVNLCYKDGEGNVWHGNASVLIFAWKNNSGEVATQAIAGERWMTYANSDGFTLGVGVGINFANGASFALPDEAGGAASLQVITGSHAWDYPDNGHHAHGIAACYLDGSNKVVITFEDGEGNIWPGTADVFALFYEPAGSVSAGGISVRVSPAGMNVVEEGQVQFTAYVGGSADIGVTWSVDGIPGGSSAVGTIDSTGLYTAPASIGPHSVRATSAANAAAYGSQTVNVGTSFRFGGSGDSIIVTPLSPALSVGDTCQFSADVSGSPSTDVTWSVNGIGGGSAAVGTISSTGLYTATAFGTFQVTAVLNSNGAVGGSASVWVGFGHPSGGPVVPDGPRY